MAFSFRVLPIQGWGRKWVIIGVAGAGERNQHSNIPNWLLGRRRVWGAAPALVGVKGRSDYRKW